MLNNIKTKNSGFTIVELLIVIVVIAILAAITIVAYNGIQNRAKASSAQAVANAVSKKAEAYNTINSNYPDTVTALKAGTQEAAIDSNTQASLKIANPTSEKEVGYKVCKNGANVTGGQVVWINYNTSATTYVSVNVGDATTAGVTCAYPAS